MKKIIYILLLTISYISYNMELIDEIKKEVGGLVSEVQHNQNLQDELKKIGEDALELGKDIVQNKDIPQDIGNLKNDALNMIQEIKNSNTFKNNNLGGSFPQGASGFPVGNASSLVSPTSPSSPSSHSSSPHVPRLNLSSQLGKSKSIKNVPKTPITSHTQLVQHITEAKKTHRQGLSESSSQLKADVEVNNNGNGNIQSPVVQKRSILPRVLNNSDTVIDAEQGMVYTVAQVWDMIQSIDPVLYNFGIDNKYSLDEVIMYGNLLHDFQVHPEALIEFVKNNCNVKLSNKTISLGEAESVIQAQVQKYQKIQKKDPAKYQAIVLDALKSIVAAEDGQATSSPLNDTHIQTLENQAVNSEATTRYQYVALLVSTLLTLGGFAWGIYGQITGTATLAPTRTPTGVPPVPTFPTGSPT